MEAEAKAVVAVRVTGAEGLLIDDVCGGGFGGVTVIGGGGMTAAGGGVGVGTTGGADWVKGADGTGVIGFKSVAEDNIDLGSIGLGAGGGVGTVTVTDGAACGLGGTE